MILRPLHELSNGQELVRHPRQGLFALVAAIVSWLANLVAIWFTLLAFGISGNAFAAAVVVFAASNLVGVVQVTPGNVGVFQLAIALALTQAYGTDRALALSFGVGLQAIEVGLGAGLGVVFASIEGMSLRDVRSEVSEARHDPSGLRSPVA